MLESPRLVLLGLVLAIMLGGHLVATTWLRRHAFGSVAADVISRLRGPALLLAWIQAGYLALRLLAPYLTRVAPSGLVTAGIGWAYALAVGGGAWWLVTRTGAAADAWLTSLAAPRPRTWRDLLLPLAGKSLRRALPLVALSLIAPAVATAAIGEVVTRVASLLLIGGVALAFHEAVDVSAAFVLRQHRIDVADNLQARAVHTQVRVLQKVAVTVIVTVALASMLMVFEPVRQFGASILASAGIAGIVVGFAAQRSIATLLAGFQIALTQPIRVDDVVIIENEWGRIEDITLTYVVVRIWDRRCLVVPVAHFIEQPFQNWTRSSSDILAAVALHVDYTMPTEPLREELTRILAASPYWDGRVNTLQVTDATAQTIEVRALASAPDAGQAWDLRCEIRERLINFIQREHPGCLPRLRAAVAVNGGT